MKNIVKLCFLVIAFTLVLSGCHGAKKKEGFHVPEKFDTSKNIEITFWAKNDTNKTQAKIYQKAIDDFEAIYPNITVNIRLYTDYGKIYNDVITNISTDTTPNVCITYPDHIATYLTGENTVVGLDSLFEDERYGLGGSEVKYDSVKKDEIIPQFLDECKIGDSHFALPFMRSTEVCYVNKTYVEALGYTLPDVLTWDFVWEVSNAAAKKTQDGTYKINGKKVMIPFIYKSSDNMMIQQLKQKNAGYSDDNGNILIFNDTTRDLLKTIADNTKSGAFSTFKISGYPANFLNAGQCVFAVDSTAGATWMGTNAPLSDISPENLAEFETAVLCVPQFDKDNIKMISQGPSVCIFNKKDSQEVLASWLFAQYLLTNDVQTAYAETEGYIPTTIRAQNSDEYKDYLSRGGEDNSAHYDVKIKASKLLLDNVENTFVTPVFNGSASLRDAAGQMIENVSKSVKRKENVDEEYLDNLFDDVTSLYRLDSRGTNSEGVKKDLGPLPKASVVLLTVLAVVWIILIGYVLLAKLKKNK